MTTEGLNANYSCIKIFVTLSLGTLEGKHFVIYDVRLKRSIFKLYFSNLRYHAYICVCISYVGKSVCMYYILPHTNQQY